MSQSGHPGHALVAKIGHRYFAKFSRTGRLQTAWCLAGAKLFRTDTTHGIKLLEILRRKRVKFTLVRVGELETEEPPQDLFAVLNQPDMDDFNSFFPDQGNNGPEM